jgi:hypothetical protein
MRHETIDQAANRLRINLDAPAKSNRSVNKLLSAVGIKERLVRVNGNCYFMHGDAQTWFSSTVGVYHISDMSVRRWVSALETLRNARHEDASWVSDRAEWLGDPENCSDRR